jgi:hypothetical protein
MAARRARRAITARVSKTLTSEKWRRGGFRSRYRLRKQTVEPVNGQIKEARSFRRFSMRARDEARGEWSLVCTAHNLLELAKARD